MTMREAQAGAWVSDVLQRRVDGLQLARPEVELAVLALAPDLAACTALAQRHTLHNVPPPERAAEGKRLLHRRRP